MTKENENNKLDFQATKVKDKYIQPQIKMVMIEMEQGIAAGSAAPASIGPEIMDQSSEEKNYDFEF
ncbi:hypothetical protein [Sphingobacterium kitahiroshimense]|uniref:Uncharacterized protein n=1 Tax=Sphingobacterium kitahiroshimense TaxID=470446 RepID=A0ABV0BQM0_9SPHI